ncbi:MAG: hypothetical protein IPK83_09845 [Planctomycetes bacterium]|nr:hypothetical protein [Planctomycetota bacterium]
MPTEQVNILDYGPVRKRQKKLRKLWLFSLCVIGTGFTLLVLLTNSKLLTRWFSIEAIDGRIEIIGPGWHVDNVLAPTGSSLISLKWNANPTYFFSPPVFEGLSNNGFVTIYEWLVFLPGWVLLIPVAVVLFAEILSHAAKRMRNLD